MFSGRCCWLVLADRAWNLSGGSVHHVGCLRASWPANPNPRRRILRVRLYHRSSHTYLQISHYPFAQVCRSMMKQRHVNYSACTDCHATCKPSAQCCQDHNVRNGKADSSRLFLTSSLATYKYSMSAHVGTYHVHARYMQESLSRDEMRI